MSGTNAHANDAMIRRLETELRESETFANGLIERANSAERDLSEDEKGMLSEKRARMAQIKEQIEQIEDVARVAAEVAGRARQVDSAISAARRNGSSVGEVEYRSAGAYTLDAYKAALGDRDARERMEVFERAAAHQKTVDNPGVVPDPIIGSVINFIDAARPIVNSLGVMPMPSASWHRPKVTARTTVGPQGSAGAAADEKSELVSQKLTISRIDGQAVTYGGYVNVSRQNIDFSSPAAFDAVINDLAAQYSIQTEAATGALLATASQTAEIPGAGAAAFTDANIRAAVWDAAAQVYATVKGQGRLVLALAPDQLKNFGPAFSPVNPQNASSTGFAAGSFGQGAIGTISGVECIMSAGLANGTAVLYSTAAVEVYEQRIGTLQVTEPSVLGVQVAYAGYFTPMAIDLGGVVKLVNAA